MKVWAEHQKSTGEIVIRCPLCREDYGQLEDIQAEYRTATLQKTRQERRDDIHMGVVCKGCNQSPITGKCYRCDYKGSFIDSMLYFTCTSVVIAYKSKLMLYVFIASVCSHYVRKRFTAAGSAELQRTEKWKEHCFHMTSLQKLK